MRRLAIFLGSVTLALLAVLLTVPWWLGLALAWAGPSWGLRVGNYERIGYSRFRIEDAEYRRAPVRVHLEAAEADTPLVWAARWAAGAPRKVRASSWTVEVTPTERRQPSGKPRGWAPLRQQLTKVADRLERWLPEAEVGPGLVTWPRGRLTVAEASWRQRRLVSPKVGYGPVAAAVEINAFADRPWTAVLQARELDASAVIRSEGAELSGEVTWAGQRAQVKAAFADAGWRPQEAAVEATQWDVAATRARLGTAYERLRGDALVNWRDGRWTAVVAAEGRPAADSPAPPLRVDVKGHGDTREFVVESLDLALPGARVQLTDPVTIDRKGKLRSGASRLVFDVDLARLPIEAAGRVTGEGRLAATEQGEASLDFEWKGEQLEVSRTRLREFSGAGRFAWPRLDLARGRLIGPTGDEVRWSGGWNFRTRELMGAEVQGRLSRETFARWLPANVAFDFVDVEARGAGTLSSLSHEGMLRVENAQVPGFRPVAVALRWHGQNDALDEVALELRSGETVLALAGAADRQQVAFASFDFRNGENARLRLVRPTRLRWDSTGLRLEPLELSGPEAGITLEGEWAATGYGRGSVRGLRAAWLRELVMLPPIQATLDSLTMDARWNDGPAVFALETAASADLGEDGTAQLAARLKGGREGVELEWLRAAANGQEILTASGRLPVAVRPFGRERIFIDQTAPFALETMTVPNPRFWSRLSRLAGIEIVAPEAQASLQGTLAQPRGVARFSAERIVPAKPERQNNWPRIENLEVRLTGAADGVQLEHCTVSIDGQSVRASGSLPVSGAAWKEILSDPQQFARRGELRVEVPDGDLAVVAQRVPAYLAPKGRLQLDLTLGGGEIVRGFLRIQDATLRPIGPLGVMQEINADLRFAGRSATIESVTGRMGGQLVTLQGRAELPPGSRPELNFTLRGQNLPFVRRAGLLVRGDLDLSLTTPATGAPKIGGMVRLRDSLFLTDVRAFIPSGTRNGGNARPPYFSVPTPPLNRWTLDVAVEGDRFMRLRTPVFAGVASARFRLGGTLGEPQASGEATVNEGSVRLPFVNFSVQQGQVRLTAEQLQPQIWLTATTRRYGYDLRMELTGPITTPNLTFNSSPPLDAEQVLLLVMAGQPPKDEVATTESQRVARVGAFFGQSLLGSFSGDAAGADRLSITSGENVSEQGRETYSIEYRLNDSWALTGEYDEFDEYYAGLKWRFFEKGGERPHASD